MNKKQNEVATVSSIILGVTIYVLLIYSHYMKWVDKDLIVYGVTAGTAAVICYLWQYSNYIKEK